MATSLGPGRGGPKSAGVARRCASPGKAASTSAFFIPQRAPRQTGGGAGIVVVVVVVDVVAAGTVLGGACCVPCSFGPQPARAAQATSRARTGRRRVGWRVMASARILGLGWGGVKDRPRPRRASRQRREPEQAAVPAPA